MFPLTDADTKALTLARRVGHCDRG
jgi:hypothetical protein